MYSNQISNTTITSHQELISSSTLNPEIENKDIKYFSAVASVQHIIRLKSLWNRFLRNPKIYAQFCDDKIAKKMFGQHIARVLYSNVSILHKVTMGLISTAKANDPEYHRLGTEDDEKEIFSMIPNDPNIDPSLEGTRKTPWQQAISSIGLNERNKSTMSEYGISILAKYAKSPKELLSSKELVRLRYIIQKSKKLGLNFNLHAEQVFFSIKQICHHPALEKLDSLLMIKDLHRIQNNIARLHLFLDILVRLHNYNHVNFTSMVEPIIHELTLLTYEINQISQIPIVDYSLFLKSLRYEFNNYDTALFPNITILGFPANSGMHSHFLATKIAKKILNISPNNQHLFGFYEHSNQYYETHDENLRYKILEINAQEKHSSQIHFINNSVMNGFTPYISEVNLAEIIKDLFAVNKLLQPKVLIIDNTNASSSVINLDSAILSLIESGALSLIYWESWQKKEY